MSLIGWITGRKDDSRLRAVGTIAAFAAGVLYAIGLIISNIYLASYGISDFSGLKVQYVFTGLLFIVFLLLPLAPVAAAVSVYRLSCRNRLSPLWRWVLAAAAFMITFVAASFTLGGLVDHGSYLPSQHVALPAVHGIPLPSLLYHWRIYGLQERPLLDRWTLGTLLGFYLGAGLLWRTTRDLTRANPARVLALLLAGYSLYTISGLYVYEKHKHLFSAFGGAAYGSLDLWIDDDGAVALRALCLPLTDGHLIERAPLVYENHDLYVVLRPPYDWANQDDDFATFVIAKKHVAAVRWVSGTDSERPPASFVPRPARCHLKAAAVQAGSKTVIRVGTELSGDEQYPLRWRAGALWRPNGLKGPARPSTVSGPCAAHSRLIRTDDALDRAKEVLG